MLFRELPALLKGKRDVFNANPKLIKVDPTYNVRDMKDPETIAHIRWLADSIKESGIQVPLEVRKDEDDNMIVVAGHCRLAAAQLAASEGWDGKVPVLQELGSINEADRVANLVISNSGKPLTPLAIAEVVRRLLAYGWTNEEIAKRLGWKSVASVENAVVLLGAAPEVQQMVRSGLVSASTATKVVKAEGSKAAATLKAAAAKTGKATTKTIRASKGEFEPNTKNVGMLVDFVKTIAAGHSGLKPAAVKLMDKLGIAA